MKRRWQRFGLIGLGMSLLLAFLVGLSSTLMVREALAAGAIEQADDTCLTARDRARAMNGVDQHLTDWWMLNRIRSYQGDLHVGVPTTLWHARGMMIQLGLALTTSPQERIDQVGPVLLSLRECGRPPEA